MTRTLGAALLALAMVAAVVWWRADGTVAHVVDDAGLFSASQQQDLQAHHRYLLLDHDIDYRVITTRNSGDINRFALHAFQQSGAGTASKTGRGLLLVVDAGLDQVRLEVSRSLEAVYPDAFVAYVQQRQMTPFFAAGRVADGILAATEMIVTRAQNAADDAGFESEDWTTASAGGGASAPARLGAGPDNGFRAGGEVRACATPQATLSAYFAAQAARNGNPALDIYTADTRAFMANRVLTAAQMDNVVKSFRDCPADAPRLSVDGRFAVIRYPPHRRQCSPWFLVRGEDGLWRLDMVTLSGAIRFGRSNAWRFVATPGPYAFAFDDWTLDRNGYPQVAR